tara:strand:- start:410 stop:910 length:501 start_codon:yes stop_codon:yes gene_type:complete
MARNPKRPGISYFGKKVETQEIRFDKNVFFEKQKSSDSNVVTTPATLFNGRQFREVKGRRRVVLADVAQTISTSTLFSGGMLPITPTGAHALQVPNAISFISGVLFEQLSAFEFTIINLAAASGPEVTLTGNTDITLIGNMGIAGATSGTFRAVRASNSDVDIFRL